MVGAATWRACEGMATVNLGPVALVETARGPIECASFGAGPPVLIVHGTPGGCDQGQALATILALRGHRVVAPSRPGYLGTRLAIGHEPADQADAAADLLDALALRRVAVVALSGGGPSALQFALRHPERTARLVLLQAISARLIIEADDLLRAALLLPRSARIAPSIVALALRRRDPALVRAALDLARSTLPIAARSGGVFNDTMQFSTLRPYPLAEVAAPTLLIHGTADANVPYEQAVAAAAAIPDARLITVPDGTHSSALFDRQAGEAVRAFLRED